MSSKEVLVEIKKYDWRYEYDPLGVNYIFFSTVCKLHIDEYVNLVYTLYKCPKLKEKYKVVLENILQNL